ncbi:MAG: MBL fold metallo-hydrolase [Bacteriovorax sp.]|nr:MBL fold metallo-hydrolase [Bacteriovorax sp.]
MKTKKLNTLTALGTGTSTGIPMIGCSCQVCRSIDHRDKRLRTSIYIETAKGNRILVDTTPDLRTQFLSNKISDIDFAIITHEHADHLHGIDDLRPLTFGPPSKEIPLYCNKATREAILKRFEYIFLKRDLKKHPLLGGGIPRLSLHQVELEQECILHGEKFFFFNYPHGHGETMGFIHDKMAYIVDCMEIPAHLLKLLEQQNLELLILDCLQRANHSTHLTVEKAFHYVKAIRPKRCGLIHIGHDLSHIQLQKLAFLEFGEKVFPLYDQLKLFY